MDFEFLSDDQGEPEELPTLSGDEPLMFWEGNKLVTRTSDRILKGSFQSSRMQTLKEKHCDPNYGMKRFQKRLDNDPEFRQEMIDYFRAINEGK